MAQLIGENNNFQLIAVPILIPLALHAHDALSRYRLFAISADL